MAEKVIKVDGSLSEALTIKSTFISHLSTSILRPQLNKFHNLIENYPAKNRNRSTKYF